jgi:hypothetical protein
MVTCGAKLTRSTEAATEDAVQNLKVARGLIWLESKLMVAATWSSRGDEEHDLDLDPSSSTTASRKRRWSRGEVV